MKESTQEIKDGVKNKLIDIMAEQISKGDDFEKLKAELSQELFNFKASVNNVKDKIFDIRSEHERTHTSTGRPFNTSGGLIPRNTYEEIYKKINGFLYDPEPINERFKDKFDSFGGRPGLDITTVFNSEASEIDEKLSSFNRASLGEEIARQIQKQKDNLNELNNKTAFSEIDKKINEEFKTLDLTSEARQKDVNELKDFITELASKRENSTEIKSDDNQSNIVFPS